MLKERAGTEPCWQEASPQIEWRRTLAGKWVQLAFSKAFKAQKQAISAP